MRNFLSLGMIVFFALNVQAQLNDYKYIVVPKKFDNFKKANQYQTSTLIKHLFTSNGYNAVYDDEMPEELYANSCMGLKVKLDDQSSMFTTKTTLILEDCTGKSLFLAQEGRSREKDYKISYKEAISESFKSIEELTYAYNGKNDPETVTLSYKNDVKELKETPSAEKSTTNMGEKAVVRQEATLENQSFKSMEPKDSNYVKGTPQVGAMVGQRATNDGQSSPVQPTIAKAPGASSVAKPEDLGVLYAQELPTGFQLVDSSPKIVMTLFKTSMKDVYAAKYGDINGLVFKKDDSWMFDYTEGKALIQKELDIKF